MGDECAAELAASGCEVDAGVFDPDLKGFVKNRFMLVVVRLRHGTSDKFWTLLTTNTLESNVFVVVEVLDWRWRDRRIAETRRVASII